MTNMPTSGFAALLAIALLTQASTLAGQDAAPEASILAGKESAPAKITTGSLGTTKNVHQCGNLYLAGQFTPEDLGEIKLEKVARIISLRTDGEIKWNEQAAVQEAGLNYVNVPFRSPESLTDDVFDKVRELLKDESTKTLFHCGSANRVGGVWLPYRVLDEGVAVETAMAEAKEIGLNAPMIEEKALDYIRRKLAELPAPESDPKQSSE